MKLTLILVVMSVMLASCSTSPVNGNFNYKKHCSADAYKKIVRLSSMQKKKRRGESSKLEDEIIKRTQLFNLESEESLKPLLFECLAESERLGNKEIYSVCLVADVDLKGKLSFYDADDQNNKLEASLKTCMINQIKEFNFSRFPGVTVIQAITMDLDP